MGRLGPLGKLRVLGSHVVVSPEPEALSAQTDVDRCFKYGIRKLRELRSPENLVLRMLTYSTTQTCFGVGPPDPSLLRGLDPKHYNLNGVWFI